MEEREHDSQTKGKGSESHCLAVQGHEPTGTASPSQPMGGTGWNGGVRGGGTRRDSMWFRQAKAGKWVSGRMIVEDPQTRKRE